MTQQPKKPEEQVLITDKDIWHALGVAICELPSRIAEKIVLLIESANFPVHEFHEAIQELKPKESITFEEGLEAEKDMNGKVTIFFEKNDPKKAEGDVVDNREMFAFVMHKKYGYTLRHLQHSKKIVSLDQNAAA